MMVEGTSQPGASDGDELVNAAAGSRRVPGAAIREILDDPQQGLTRIVDALYLKDGDAARTGLALLRAELAREDCPLAPEVHEVVALYLHWLDWQVVRSFAPLEARPAKYAEVLAAFDRPAATPLGNICRCQLALQLLINQEGPENLSLGPERFHALYAAVPPAYRHSEFCYYVASWAFRHNDLQVLEDAYEFLTVHPDGMSSDYTWQYVNLMYQLLKRTVTPRDVHELLKRMQLPQELRQFERFIYPEIVRRGLLDEGMNDWLLRTRQRLEAMPPHRPHRELATKRIKRNH
jgi:hypothetical protein